MAGSQGGKGAIAFQGKNSVECENFIQTIQDYAFAQGKPHDDVWIAEFAGARLYGNALRWYTDLDEDTQASWKLLRKALLKRYPTSIASTSAVNLACTVPSPPIAAAPAPASATRAPCNIGRIRVVAEDHNYDGYISSKLGPDGNITRTTEVSEAAIAQFYPSSKPSEIRLIGMQLVGGTAWLGLHWRKTGTLPDFSAKSISDGALVCLTRPDPGVLLSSSRSMCGPMNSGAWSVLWNGTVLALQQKGDRTLHLLEMYVSKGDQEIGFAVSLENLEAGLEKMGYLSMFSRAKFTFEPQ